MDSGSRMLPKIKDMSSVRLNVRRSFVARAVHVHSNGQNQLFLVVFRIRFSLI
jgi:hypothetical protein